MSDQNSLPTNESINYWDTFMAGWEFANWKLGPHCPDSNILLAEFSARLKINWPPQANNTTQYISLVRAALESRDRQLAYWLSVGLLSNGIVHETRSIKRRFKKFSKQSIPKRLLSLQTELANILVKTDMTPEERQDLVIAVRNLLKRDMSEEEAVFELMHPIENALTRIESNNSITTSDIPKGDKTEDLKGKIDFAILTVREDENRAVLKRFPKDMIYAGKHRSYSISRVPLEDGGYYLVAVVRSIEQGEGHGQDVARDAIEDLDPQWLLLVGIAGGAPAVEFTLGDVVAALRLTDFSVKAALEDKPVQYAVGGGPMHKQVQNYLALLSAMSDELGDWNSQTSIGMDRPPVKLVARNFYGDEDWQKKVKEYMTRHFGRFATPRRPLVTTGTIASSDTLIKDSRTLQQWQESARQVIAVEMELAGVYIAARRAHHEYPVLAIRGISDIVGFKRHPDWTEYACNSAASFAHALVKSKPIKPRFFQPPQGDISDDSPDPHNKASTKEITPPSGGYSDSSNTLQEYISVDPQAIKQQLGLDRPLAAITESLELSFKSISGNSIFDAGGLCSGYTLQPLPDRYFVAQEFNANRDDLRFALTRALEGFGVKPICTDDSLWPGYTLCKISALIKSTPFGVYQLTPSQSRNVYLELGIALGLGRPFVLVKDKDAGISNLIRGLDFFPINSYLELGYELGTKIEHFLTNISKYQSHALPQSESQRTAVIVHGDLDVIDFCVAVGKAVYSRGLTPVFLSDPTGNLSRYLRSEETPHQILGIDGRLQLNETVNAIQASQLGIYHIDKNADPDAFLALGISMGLNRPGFLTHMRDSNCPSDLEGINILKFNSYSDLSRSLPRALSHLLHNC